MKVIAVDDEPWALDDALRCLLETAPDIEARGFLRPAEALEWVRGHPVDVMLLDIEMPGMDGIALARAVQEVRPDVRIIFVTSFEHHALKAFSVHATAYLLKPIEADELARELAFVRGYGADGAPPDERPHVRVVTFGGFELYVEGEPLAISRSKAKELLALLVDRRGAGLSLREACAFLWPDAPYSNAKRSYYQNMVSLLRTVLDEAGIGDVLVKRRNSLAIDPKRIDCDLYRLLEGDPVAIASYRCDYLPQYEWAEMTAAELERRRSQVW